MIILIFLIAEPFRVVLAHAALSHRFDLVGIIFAPRDDHSSFARGNIFCYLKA